MPAPDQRGASCRGAERCLCPRTNVFSRLPHLASPLPTLGPSSLDFTAPPRPQIARAKQIKATYLQTQAHGQTDARKRAELASRGVIVSLGLMEDDAGEGTGGKEGGGAGAAGKQAPKRDEGAGETGQGSR